MQIHLLPQRLAPFAGVHELAADGEAEADVVGAAAPFEVPHGPHGVGAHHLGPALVVRLAVACFDGALAAGPGYRVRHGRAGYRVDERRLPATCKTITPLSFCLNVEF